MYANEESVTTHHLRYFVYINEGIHHIVLKEGIAMKNSGVDFVYYSFKLANDENVESVNFQVTLISGKVHMFASSVSPYPSINFKFIFNFLYNNIL